MANIGYKRVSTAQQVTDRQLVGVELDKVFEDKLSGKNTDRPQFQAMMRYVLSEGDVLHVDSLDRLGRNLTDILNTVNELNAKGVALVAKKENIDTRRKDPVSMATVQLFGVFAELERNMMLTRQREAMEAARANGTWKPRGKGKDVNHEGIAQALLDGLSVRKIAAMYNVSPSTVQRAKTSLEAVAEL